MLNELIIYQCLAILAILILIYVLHDNVYIVMSNILVKSHEIVKMLSLLTFGTYVINRLGYVLK